MSARPRRGAATRRSRAAIRIFDTLPRSPKAVDGARPRNAANRLELPWIGGKVVELGKARRADDDAKAS